MATTIPSAEDLALAEAILDGTVVVPPGLLEACAPLIEGEPLRGFMERVSPHLPPPRHLQPLIDILESCRLRRREVCVSMPPRHAKTTTLVHGLGWWASRFPSDTSAYFSYSDTQGRSKSRLARAIAERAGVPIDPGKNATNEWRTTAGGGLLAGGIGGALTGHGIQGIFGIDDPYKNREEADSPVIREKVWEWFTEVAYTRLEGASMVVTHTRWHEDDLIGRLAAQGWEVVNVPAIAEADDVLGRRPGEELWDRFPISRLRSILATIGDFSFAALYQGRPRPRGHQIFGEPTYYDPSSFRIDGKRIVIAIDPAASEKTSADYSVLLVLAVEPEPAKKPELRKAWVLHVHRAQKSVPEFAKDALEIQRRYGMAKIHVETVAGFKAVPQIMRELAPGIAVEDHDPDGDKFQRAQPVAAAWSGGRLLVPTSAPWLKDFLAEVRAFTGVGSRKDDQVDALSTAWNAYRPPAGPPPRQLSGTSRSA
jgi:predicted phage terminase large subunit-like protein